MQTIAWQSGETQRKKDQYNLIARNAKSPYRDMKRWITIYFLLLSALITISLAYNIKN